MKISTVFFGLSWSFSDKWSVDTVGVLPHLICPVWPNMHCMAVYGAGGILGDTSPLPLISGEYCVLPPHHAQIFCDLICNILYNHMSFSIYQTLKFIVKHLQNQCNTTKGPHVKMIPHEIFYANSGNSSETGLWMGIWHGSRAYNILFYCWKYRA